MTTIVGIKTNTGDDAVVLAVDTQVSYYNADEELIATGVDFKMTSDMGSWAIACAGNFDKYVQAFFKYLEKGGRDYAAFLKKVSELKPKELKKLREDCLDSRVLPAFEAREHAANLMGPNEVKPASPLEKRLLALSSGAEPSSPIESFMLQSFRSLAEMNRDPVHNAIRTGYFPEVAVLNSYAEARGVEAGELTGFLLASKWPEVELYEVLATGVVREVKRNSLDIDAAFLGSGGDTAKKYFADEKYKKERIDGKKIEIANVTTRVAVRLARKAVKLAHEDGHTGGPIDIAVITKDDCRMYGKNLKSELERTEEGCYMNIEGEYQPPEK